MTTLMDANVNPDYGMFNRALFKSLSEMVKNPPLPENADPTAENRRARGDWWAKNKDTARFVRVSPYE